MSRDIPVQLFEHMQGPATTLCLLLKIILRDGRVFGLAGLDRDVPFDDGTGLILYHSTQGADVSNMLKGPETKVANAEAMSLLVSDGHGITEAMIEAGELADAEWVLYQVNYANVSMGSIIMDAGDLGEVTKKFGMVWIPELLSYSVRLRQPSGTHWSRTCRAIYGTPANSQTGCGVNAEAQWQAGEVIALSAEPDVIFAVSQTLPADIAPGRIQMLTGANAGRVRVIESVDGQELTLSTPFPYQNVVGDTCRVRPDCAKTTAACKSKNNYLNMKAEDNIPQGDAQQLSTPGGGGGGGSVGDIPPMQQQ